MASSELSAANGPTWVSHSLTLLLALVLIFVMAVAGTWPGIADVKVTQLALAVLALLVIAWLLTRYQYRYTWHKTPLDRLLVYWFIAFAISTAANWLALSNITTGLWFIGLYILVWYMACDMRANRLLTLSHILNALLLAGLVVLVSAFSGPKTNVTRIAGMMQNPNILAALLILIILILVERVAQPSSPVWVRVGYAAYLLAALVALYLTQSRGAVLGVCAGAGTVLYVKARRPITRLLLLLAGLLVALALFGIRGDAGRLPIYRRALFFQTRAPFTGQGLFTFRTGAKTAPGARPDGQTLHAHNAVLEIAVELGPFGVAALFASLVYLLRVLERLAWPKQRWVIAALIGLLAQQMVDFTIMTPSIALCAVLMSSMMMVDDDRGGNGNRWPVLILGVLALALLLVGAIAGNVPLGLLR